MKHNVVAPFIMGELVGAQRFLHDMKREHGFDLDIVEGDESVVTLVTLCNDEEEVIEVLNFYDDIDYSQYYMSSVAVVGV